MKEIGLVNTKAVCSALTASPERMNEVLLSSQRLLYAKKWLENQQKTMNHVIMMLAALNDFAYKYATLLRVLRNALTAEGEALACLAGIQRNYSEPELAFHYSPTYIHYIHKIHMCIHTQITSFRFGSYGTGRATTIIFSTRLNTKFHLGYKESSPSLLSILLKAHRSNNRR